MHSEFLEIHHACICLSGERLFMEYYPRRGQSQSTCHQPWLVFSTNTQCPKLSWKVCWLHFFPHIRIPVWPEAVQRRLSSIIDIATAPRFTDISLSDRAPGNHINSVYSKDVLSAPGLVTCFSVVQTCILLSKRIQQQWKGMDHMLILYKQVHQSKWSSSANIWMHQTCTLQSSLIQFFAPVSFGIFVQINTSTGSEVLVFRRPCNICLLPYLWYWVLPEQGTFCCLRTAQME